MSYSSTCAEIQTPLHCSKKKKCTKINKEAVACAKSLPGRLKEAKEKCEEQISRKLSLSSLRASISKSTSS